jgi:hypothetical protein
MAVFVGVAVHAAAFNVGALSRHSLERLVRWSFESGPLWGLSFVA